MASSPTHSRTAARKILEIRNTFQRQKWQIDSCRNMLRAAMLEMRQTVAVKAVRLAEIRADSLSSSYRVESFSGTFCD
jgi:hypothetical protein